MIVTADHGEAFGEHGVVEHSRTSTRSSWCTAARQAPGQTRGDVVASVERGRAGDCVTLEGDGGRALTELFPRTPGSHPVVAENSYSRLRDLQRFGTRFHRRRRAIYRDGLKLVIDSTGEHELFDLAADPGEARDLAAERPDDVESLLRADHEFTEPRRFEGDRALLANLTSAEVQVCAPATEANCRSAEPVAPWLPRRARRSPAEAAFASA